MEKLFKLMENFGAEFLPHNKTKFPINLSSSSLPIGIDYVAGSSAQLKSAVILAGLNSFGCTNILEKQKSRNHTENILAKSSNVIKFKKKNNTNFIKIYGKKYLDAIKFSVPSDPSNAAFYFINIIEKKSSIRINNLNLNESRIGFYSLMKKHGAKIKFINLKKNNEKVGDLIVKSCKIKPIRASKEYYVSSTDEYPIMFVIAALTKGISVFKGISDLANKESNRINEMKKILKQIGVKCVTKKDEMKIYGLKEIKNQKKNNQST